MPRILVVEDDPTIRLAMEFSLKRAGYAVTVITNGNDAITSASQAKPDLILLDIMLPGANGFDVARAIRQFDFDTPIIMVTALARDEDNIRGLDAGADDYITKPFSTDVLLARIRANMRRAQNRITPPTNFLEYGDLSIDTIESRVQIAGKTIELRSKEYALLLALAIRPGALCKRQWLTRQVWGEDFLGTSRTIDVHIRRIRKAIEEPSAYTFIQTVRSMGYRFEALPKSLDNNPQKEG